MKAIRMHTFAWFAYLFEPEDSSLPAIQHLTIGLTKISPNRFMAGLDQVKWFFWTGVAILSAILIAKL